MSRQPLTTEQRRRMIDHPSVDLIDELHWLGRKLVVLRRLYQSYELIMRRLLQRQRLFRDDARSNHGRFWIGGMFDETDSVDTRQPTLRSQSNMSVGSNYDTPGGVPLSSAAVSRSERLVDRINLYCLSEIEAWLTEKDSLTFLVGSFSFALSMDEMEDVLIMLNNTNAELQPHRSQRFPGRGETDANHRSPSQSNHSLPTGQSDDCVFFNADRRPPGSVYKKGLLG